MQVDTHGMEKTCAHAYVRAILLEIIQSIAIGTDVQYPSLTIITGKGNNSSHTFEPTVRTHLIQAIFNDLLVRGHINISGDAIIISKPEIQKMSKRFACNSNNTTNAVH
jgi:hypothetical protein